MNEITDYQTTTCTKHKITFVKNSWCIECYKEIEAENKRLKEMMHVEKDGKCHVCNKMTDSLTGNPTKWGHFFAHMDGQTKHRWYHVGCLYPILNKALKE